MSRPRNERSPEPRDRVGDRLNRGQLSGGIDYGRIWVNCALLGTGVTVEISPDEADGFALSLAMWARQVRSRATDPNP